MNVRESFINFSRFTEVLKKNFCSFITIYFRLKFHEIMHKKASNIYSNSRECVEYITEITRKIAINGKFFIFLYLCFH